MHIQNTRPSRLFRFQATCKMVMSLMLVLAILLASGTEAFAQRRGGGGGGMRAGGGDFNRQGNVNQVNVNRMSGAQPARGNFNNVNVNRTNVNNVNVNNVNAVRPGYPVGHPGYPVPVPVPVPVPYHGGYYGPSAGSVAVGVAAGMVAGAYLASLPPKTVVISAPSGQIIYKSNTQCYREVYQGSTIVYEQIPCP